MAEKTIMLVCEAGISTSLLVSKMQKAAEEKGIRTNIFAAAAANAKEKFNEQTPDVLMLGPQVRYLEETFQEKTDIPVRVINMSDYSKMNGEKVLDEALEILQ